MALRRRPPARRSQAPGPKGNPKTPEEILSGIEGNIYRSLPDVIPDGIKRRIAHTTALAVFASFAVARDYRPTFRNGSGRGAGGTQIITVDPSKYEGLGEKVGGTVGDNIDRD